MPLAAATRLGPYEIVSPLGAGGMGEVYRGRDTRLGRDVAIKVLPSELASSPELRARLEREARTISSLNHPNICTLYDVGREGETAFLVMELVEGESLANRLARGPMPTEALLKTAVEIADALQRAHRAGIIHRDLKPGNVMLTRSGAKLMDFGLARAAGTIRGSAGPDLSQAPTVSQPLTERGTIVGTFQYMAPEQLEGKEADERADLWAFGAVLYEMATGKKAFEGKSQASLIAAIMGPDPPPIMNASPLSPPALDRIVHACLAKDPEDRFSTAHDVKLQLEWIRDGGSQVGVPSARTATTASPRWMVAGATGLIVLLAGVLMVPRLLRKPEPPQLMRFALTAPEGTTMSRDVTGSAISPDGSKVVFVARDSTGTSGLWIRSLESLTAQPLTGTDHSFLPFWSPDGREIGFFADGKLKSVSANGGSPEVICDCDALEGRGATWSRNGTILVAPVASGSIYRVAGDGRPTLVMGPDSATHETGLRFPSFLPDGKHFLFLSLPQRRGLCDVFVGALGSNRRTKLMTSAAMPVFAEPGYLVFVRNGRLMAQRFDPDRLALMGNAQVLGEAPPPSSSIGAPAVSISRNGILAHPRIVQTNTELVWLDHDGKQTGAMPVPLGHWAYGNFSPDGQRLVIERAMSSSEVDLWMIDLSRIVATRLTFTNAPQTANAVWSPDGRWIAFNSDKDSTMDIYRKAADGTGEEELLFHSNAPFKNPRDWSRDGRFIVFEQPDPATGWDIWLLPIDGERKPIPFLHSRLNERGVSCRRTDTGSRTHQMNPERTRSTSSPFRRPKASIRSRHPVVTPPGGCRMARNSSSGVTTVASLRRMSRPRRSSRSERHGCDSRAGRTGFLSPPRQTSRASSSRCGSAWLPPTA